MKQMASLSPDRPGTRFSIVPLAGLAWNVIGLVQFVNASTSSQTQLIASGMTPVQAAIYAGLPAWMTTAFAVGVIGGLIGSVLLVLRRSAAVAVFAASLAGYLILYAGDITEGVFAAFGVQQVAILTTVVVIAGGLLWFAWRARRLGQLS